MKTLIDLMERGWIPDTVVRAGIRRLLARRLRGWHLLVLALPLVNLPLAVR